MDKIAVLIPCYNEEKTIYKVVTDFKAVLPDSTIYVYDNNSSDKTSELAEKAGAVVRKEYKQGKGNVIRRMFREIDAEVYIIQENKRPFHNFGNSIVRWSINNLFKTSIKDIMTGYRAFSYEFVKTYPVMSKGFEIETEMSIHAVDRNMQVENVIIEYRDRPDGSESKLNTYSDGIKVLLTIVKLYKNYKPFGFFTAISLVLALCSILFFIPVLSAYFKTGVVDRFPTLIVCGFVMVMAILFFAVGVLLSTLRSQDKRDFEYKLIQVDHMKKTSK